MATTTTQRTDTPTRAREMSANQVLAVIFGLTYLALGLIGWAVTSKFVGEEDANLLGLHLNGMHNLVHLLLGVGWLLAARRLDWSRAVNGLFGATLMLVGLVGLFGVLDELLNVEDAAAFDNYVHLGTGLLAVLVARLADRPQRTTVT